MRDSAKFQSWPKPFLAFLNVFGAGTSARRRRNTQQLCGAEIIRLEGRVMLSAGSVDPSFGSHGVEILSKGGMPIQTATLTNGTTLVLSTPSSSTAGQLELLRISSNGAIDTTFGNKGVVNINLKGAQFQSNPLQTAKCAALADGKILIAGSEQNAILLIRLNANGSLDQTFSNGSTSIKGIISSPLNGAGVGAVLVRPQGQIVVAGVSTDSSFQQVWAITQFKPNGALDTSFGDHGHTLTNVGGFFPGIETAVLESNGNLIVAGNTDPLGAQVPILARYTSKGHLDSTFGHGGISTPNIASDGLILSIALQKNGEIVVGAIGSPTATGDFIGLLARLKSDGTLDSNFGSHGIVQLQNIPGLSSIVVDASDRILVAGGTTFTLGYVRVMRFTSSGHVDNSFGSKGVFQTKFGGSDVAIEPILSMQTDGRIVVAATVDHMTGQGMTLELGLSRLLG